MDLKDHTLEIIIHSGLSGISFNDILNEIVDKNVYNPFRNMEIDQYLKEYLFNYILAQEYIEIYSYDNNINNIIKSKKEEKRVFPHVIYNPDLNHYGYCKEYYNRINITIEVRELYQTNRKYDIIFTKYGDNLKFVADQNKRCFELNYFEFCESTICEYGLLEIISSTREKGFQQHCFINYDMDSVISHYLIGRLLDRKLIVKIESLSKMDNSPMNLCILSKFYDPYKFHQLYYSTSNFILDEQNYKLLKKIIKHVENNKITFKELFNYLENKLSIDLLQFQNLIEFLIKFSIIDIPNEDKIKTKFRKRIGENLKHPNDSSQSVKYWISNPSHKYWNIIIVRKPVKICSAFNSKDEDTHHTNKMYRFSIESNFIVTAYHFINCFGSKGCVQKDLMRYLSCDFSLARRIIKKLEVYKVISSNTIRIGKIYQKRIICNRYHNNEIEPMEKNIIIPSTIDLIKYIKEYTVDKPKRALYLTKTDTTNQLNLIIFNIHNDGGIIKNLEEFNNKYNESAFNYGLPKLTHEKLLQFINDLKLIKVIKKSILRFSYNKIIQEITIFYLEPELYEHEENKLILLFANELKNCLMNINLDINNCDLLENISRSYDESKKVININKYVNIDKPIHDTCWVEKHSDYFKRLISEASRGVKKSISTLIPKFARTRILHIYILKLIYGDEIDTQLPDDPIYECFYWLSFVKTIKTRDIGWFDYNDIIHNMPLVVFIQVFGFALNIDIVKKLIEASDKYMHPYENIMNDFKQISLSLLQQKLNVLLNYLFILRLVAVTKNSSANTLLKTKMFVLKSVMMYDNDQKEDIKFIFNNLCSSIRFWDELKKRALKYHPVNPNSPEYTFRNYVNKLIVDDNKLIIHHVVEDGIVGYPSNIYLQLVRNWNSCFPFTPIIKTSPVKRRNLTTDNEVKYYKRSILIVCSSLERNFIISFIIHKLKPNKLQMLLPLIRHKFENIEDEKYTLKKFQIAHKIIYKNQDLKSAIFHLIRSFRHSKYFVNALSINNYNDCVKELINCIEEKLNDMRNKLSKVPNIRITYMNDCTNIRYFKNNILKNENDISQFKANYYINCVLIKLALCPKNISDEQIQNFYDNIGFAHGIKIIKDSIRSGFISKISNFNYQSLFNGESFENFKIIVSRFLNNHPSKKIKLLFDVKQRSPINNQKIMKANKYRLTQAVINAYLEGKAEFSMTNTDLNFNLYINKYASKSCTLTKEIGFMSNNSNYNIHIKSCPKLESPKIISYDSIYKSINLNKSNNNILMIASIISNDFKQYNEDEIHCILNSITSKIESYDKLGVDQDQLVRYIDELSSTYNIIQNILMEWLQELIKNKIIYQFDDNTHTFYIHSKYSSFWSIKTNDQEHEFQSRPYINEINGQINTDVLDSICQNIIKYIFKNPGCHLQSIIFNFSTVMLKQDILRVVQYMEDNKMIISQDILNHCHTKIFNRKIKNTKSYIVNI